MALPCSEDSNFATDTMSNVQNNEEGAEVPSLDFDSSTITSPSPVEINGLNPQAPSFHYENLTFLDHQTPLYSGEIPTLDQAYPMNYAPANDDLRW